MKLLRFSLAFGALASLLAACGGSAEPVGSSGQSVVVCDPIKCPAGEVWNESACKCEPRVVCDPIKCPAGSVWSEAACKCECVDLVVCIVGEHFDEATCGCKPNTKCSPTEACPASEYCCGCGGEGTCLARDKACPLLCPVEGG
jgi:hypothetical protein